MATITIAQNLFLGDVLLGQTYLGNELIGTNPYTYVEPAYVTSGSVLILDAGDTTSYPGTGNTWFDLSGYGNNAALTNMAANYSSANGGYFDFPNNAASLMTITQSGSLNNAFAGDFTIDMWLTIDQFLAGAGDWVTPFAKSSLAGICVILNRDTNATNRGLNRFYYNSVSYAPATKVTLTAGAWFNYQITRSGTTMTFYQNTGSLGTATVSGDLSNTSNLTLGYGFNGSTYPYDGKMGWVGMYNRALSAAELQQNYNFIKTRYGL